MGTDLRGRDLGKGLDQIPSGLYRLRTMLHGQRLTETHEDLEYLRQLSDKVERMKRDTRTRGLITQLTTFSDPGPVVVTGDCPVCHARISIKGATNGNEDTHRL